MVIRKLSLLQGALFALAFAWPLDQLVYRRSGYIVSIFFILLYLGARFHAVPLPIALYSLVFFLAFAVQVLLFDLSWASATLAMSAYLALPLLAGCIRLTYAEILKVFSVFKIIVVIYFVGFLAQVAGVDTGVLSMSMTETFGEVHDRYTSIAGNPLLLGMYSFFAIFVCLAEYPQTQGRKKFVLVAIIGIALICLYYSYARRYYVLTFACFIYFLWFFKRRTSSANAFGLLAASIILLAVAAFGFVESNRARSIVDFSADAGNMGRMLLWQNSLEVISQNPWIGKGVGSEGSVGQSDAELQERLDEGNVAEMYFLKVAVEFGAFVGIFFGGWMIFLTLGGFQSRSYLLSAIPMLAFLDCIMGGALASPFFAFPFWLLVAQLCRKAEPSFLASDNR